MSLSVILATRKRPDLLPWTIDQTLRNVALPDTKLVIAVDDDDKETIGFVPHEPRVLWSIRPREDSLGEKYNRVLEIAPADVYLVMVDYAPHVTPGFDRKILEAAKLFPDGIGVIYNHWATARFPVMNAVTYQMANLMGGIYPAWYPYWFIDHQLDDIAKMIGRIAWADVEVNRDRRPGTQDKRDPAFWATFYDAMRGERHEIAERILSVMDEPKWRKALLRNAWYAIDEHSERVVNDEVRREAPHHRTVPPDERYVRIKARAKEELRRRYEQLAVAA